MARYSAFISYRHQASRGFAKRLEYALAKYAQSAFQRPLRIFRDENYLVPTADLPELIRGALETSDFLILLASPGAAQSQWVRDEMRIWCEELKRSDRLMIVLTAGEIAVDAASKEILWSDTDALPANLERHLRPVPFFLDARRQQDESTLTLRNPDFKHAVNAISARMRGVEPNEMLGVENREYRRNLVQRRIAVGSLVALTVALAIFAQVAVTSRNSARTEATEAKRQQEIAEAARTRSRDSLLLATARSMPNPERVALLREVSSPPAGWEQDAREALARPPFAFDRLPKQTQGIIKVALSNDKTFVLSASFGGRILLWPVQRDRAPVEYDHPSRVLDACISPDSRVVAVAGVTGKAALLSADGTRPASELVGHTSDVLQVSFSRDGRLVVTASRDGTARVWPVSGHEPPVVLRHPAAVTAAVFSPDGHRVITNCADGSTRVWTMNPPAAILLLPARSAAADTDSDLQTVKTSSVNITGRVPLKRSFAQFSPDGLRVLIGRTEDAELHIVPVDGRGRALTLRTAGPVKAAAFDQQGDQILAASEHEVRVWAWSKGNEPLILDVGKPVTTASFSPDGKRIVTGSSDGVARYWSSTGQLIFGLDQGIDTTADGAIMDAAFGHDPGFDPKRDAVLDEDPNLIVTGTTSGVVRLWRMRGAGEPLHLRHSAAVHHASFSPDESMVVAGCDDGSARIWRIPERTFRELPRHGGAVVRAIFDRAQRSVLTASTDGIARVSALDESLPSLEFGEGRVPIVSAEFDPDGSHVLLLFQDHRAVRYRADDPHAIVEQLGGIGLATYTAPGNWYSAPAFSNATAYAYDRLGDRVIVGFYDGKVVRASPASQDLLGNHDGPVLAIALSSSGDRVVTSGADGKAFVIPLSAPSDRVVLDAHRAAIVSAAFRPPLGDKIVTASIDGVARLWSVGAASQSIMLNGSGGSLTYATFSPKGDSVLTASEGNNVLVWAVDVMPALWRATRYCLPTEDRRALLAESEDEARRGFETCRSKTAR